MPQNAKKVIRPLTVREVLTLINSLSEHLQTFQGDRDFACDWCGRVLHEHEDESQACPRSAQDLDQLARYDKMAGLVTALRKARRAGKTTI